MLGGIQFLGKSQSRWYEARIFPWGWWRRGPVIRQQLRGYSRRLSQTLFGPGRECPRELLAPSMARWKREQRRLQKQEGLGKKAAGWQSLLAPLNKAGMNVDVQASFRRVLSHDEWAQVQAAEGDRESSRLALRTAKEQHREQCLLVDKQQVVAEANDAHWTAAEAFSQACRLRNVGGSGSFEAGDAQQPSTMRMKELE